MTRLVPVERDEETGGEKDEGEAIKRKGTTDTERELWIIFVHRENTLQRISPRRHFIHNATPDKEKKNP